MSKVFLQRFVFVALIFLFVSGNIFSQLIPDSLLSQLNRANDSDRAKALNMIAEYLSASYPLKAMEYAENALSAAIEIQDSREHVNALLNIGDCYYYMDNYEEAGKYYINALQTSIDLDQPKSTALSYYFLALNFEAQNDFVQAEKNFIRAIQAYELLGEIKELSGLNYELAELLQKKGDNYQALKYYEESARLYDSLGQVIDAAETMNTIGVLYYNWGNYEKAIDYYKKSLMEMYKNDNEAGIAQILNNLGIVSSDGGNIEEALRYFEESLEIERKLNDSLGMATSYNNIGIVYIDLNKPDLALKYYEESLAIYQDLDDKSGIATALNNIGDLYSDSGNSDLAILMLQRSLQLEKEINDQYGIAIAFITLSQLYIKSGDMAVAKMYNDSCFQMNHITNNPEILMSLYENYYKISEAQNQVRQALDYYKKYTFLKDSIYNESIHKQLAETKTRYELEQKDQQIELLNSKNMLNQLELKNKQFVVYWQRIVLVIALISFVIVLIFLLILFKQITKKRKVYRLLDEQNREILQGREQLVIAKEKAEESDHLKSVFLANMSHELRTPLNGILGFTDVLRTEIEDVEFRNMADIIHASGNRLLDTLNSIIDLSIIESNSMELDYSEIPLFEFISERVMLFNASATNKNLDLDYEVCDKDVLVYSDRKILTNLLNNLIDNAIKYTQKGGVGVFASIIERQNKSWLKLQVTDTGIGIDKDKLENVFDNFRQGSEGHDRQFEGAGLGLSICKKYIEILDGEIKLESQLDQGSTFTVLVPVKISILPSSHEYARVNTQKDTPDLKREFSNGKPDMLIVENDEINTAHLLHIFKDMCFVKTASSGAEALKLVQSIQFKVILMDINLGIGMNGMQTAQAIRKFDGYSNTPIIAVTANAMKGHKEEFLANGCSHYISKPFSSDMIKQLVFDAVEGSTT